MEGGGGSRRIALAIPHQAVAREMASGGGEGGRQGERGGSRDGERRAPLSSSPLGLTVAAQVVERVGL